MWIYLSLSLSIIHVGTWILPEHDVCFVTTFVSIYWNQISLFCVCGFGLLGDVWLLYTYDLVPSNTYPDIRYDIDTIKGHETRIRVSDTTLTRLSAMRHLYRHWIRHWHNLNKFDCNHICWYRTLTYIGQDTKHVFNQKCCAIELDACLLLCWQKLILINVSWMNVKWFMFTKS